MHNLNRISILIILNQILASNTFTLDSNTSKSSEIQSVESYTNDTKIFRPPEQSKLTNEFILWSTKLSEDRHLITRHYTLGQRQSDKDKLAKEQREQLGDVNCKKQCKGTSWEVRVEFPHQVGNYVITFIDLTVSQTSTGTKVKVTEGGYGHQKIRFSISTNVTSVVDFRYKIYVKDIEWE